MGRTRSAEAYAQAALTRHTERGLLELFGRCWQDAFEAGRRDGQHELLKIATDTDRRVRARVSQAAAGSH